MHAKNTCRLVWRTYVEEKIYETKNVKNTWRSKWRTRVKHLQNVVTSSNFAFWSWVMSQVYHMLASLSLCCMRTMSAMARCAIRPVNDSIFSITAICFDGSYPSKAATSENNCSKLFPAFFMLGKMVHPINRRLWATLVKATVKCVSWVTFNIYCWATPLVGWDSGRLCPSRVLTKYNKALTIWGHSCSNESGSLLVFSKRKTNISNHSTSVWSQGPSLKFLRGHLLNIWYN